jgi:ribose 5-phosphate isomerase B
MRVHLGSDHAGFELKSALLTRLQELGYEPVDHGPHAFDAQDDYPPYVLAAAVAAASDPESRGIVIGGSGNGEAIAANKVRGVRAALAFSDETARLGREHNNANVLSLGGRMYPVTDALRFAEIFLSTDFTNEERHVRRLAMLDDYERTGQVPPA